jgi:uncharacterized RDD family membrane protein YckC
MEPPPSSGPEPPRGFHSARARDRLNLWVGILSACFLLAQIALPLGAMFLIASRSTTRDPFGVQSAQVGETVFSDGAIYYLEEPVSRSSTSKRHSTLQMLRWDDRSDPKSVAPAFLENPRLLASDRVWIISPENVRYYRDGRLTVMNVDQRLGNISNPFLYRGLPAVLEERPGRMALIVLRGGRWEIERFFQLGPENEEYSMIEDLRVVSIGDDLHLFLLFGDTVFYRKGIPEQPEEEWESWEPVCASETSWTTVAIQGEPAVFRLGTEEWRRRVEGYRRQDGKWRSFSDVGIPGNAEELGVAVPPPGEKWILVLRPGEGRVRFLEVEGSKILRTRRVGAITFPKRQFAYLWGGFLVGNQVSLWAFVAIVSCLVQSWRRPEYRSSQGSAIHASVLRRAAAGVLDSILLSLPPLIVLGVIYRRPTGVEWFSSDPRFAVAIFALVLGGLAWWVVSLVLISFLQGKWGWSPGQYLVRIRALGTDLRPCGFGRGLVRNLLLFLDGYFSYLVGVVTVAVTENRQRVGDLLAKTVVLRVGPGGALLAPEATPAGSGGPAISPHEGDARAGLTGPQGET